MLSLRPDRNGIQYVQLQTLQSEGSQGGALVDGQGVVRGLRMSRAQMLELFDNAFGEWAMESQALANQLVPQLEAGIGVIDTPASTCGGDGPPPPRPGVFRGDITSGGATLPAGATVYARVRGGGAEEWYTGTVGNTGRYYISIGTCTQALDGANVTVDFWYDRKVAPQTPAFRLQTSTELELVFP